MSAVVKWGDQFSSPISVTSGVRQGGILSPVLFNLYVDTLIKSLRKSDLGCHFHNMFVGCIMYADDLLLISASLVDLQCMIDNCCTVGAQLGIQFNYSKCKCMIIGPNTPQSIADLKINGKSLMWESQIKYLGVLLRAGKTFGIDLSEVRRKFFISVNSILCRAKYANDITKLHLLESQCLPILLYAIESVSLSNNELRQINSWWNSVYRKIFHYNKWESVKELIHYLRKLDVLHLENLRRMNFIKKLLSNENSNQIVKNFIKLYAHTSEFFSVCFKYNLKLHWSVYKMKATMLAQS